MQTDTSKPYDIVRDELLSMVNQLKSNQKPKGFLFCFFFTSNETQHKFNCERISSIFKSKFGFASSIIELNIHDNILHLISLIFHSLSTLDKDSLFTLYFSGYGHISNDTVALSPSSTDSYELNFLLLK